MPQGHVGTVLQMLRQPRPGGNTDLHVKALRNRWFMMVTVHTFRIQRNHSSHCLQNVLYFGGLNETGPQRQLHLNGLFPATGGLGSTMFDLGEGSLLGLGLRFQKPISGTFSLFLCPS